MTSVIYTNSDDGIWLRCDGCRVEYRDGVADQPVPDKTYFPFWDPTVADLVEAEKRHLLTCSVR